MKPGVPPKGVPPAGVVPSGVGPAGVALIGVPSVGVVPNGVGPAGVHNPEESGQSRERPSTVTRRPGKQQELEK